MTNKDATMVFILLLMGAIFYKTIILKQIPQTPYKYHSPSRIEITGSGALE